ncbi:nuclear valosin-containing protein-like [Pectinophora gossypiella]|uniref:nuclear valosin-containing protein-like n=1 Tax=Pectinophora gossypiella TaxID=13191 RepID=UPI00214E635C|nr:nuclear valosin-containing protein-like [Pectinophora gossypiella]
MKKHQTRQKVMNDPVIVSRVKNYLAENVDKTYVDVGQMARSLKERYREYNHRNDSAFCQLVESAYKVVLQSYGLDGASTSDGSDEESDLELLDENNSALNDRILQMYKMQDKKRPATSRRPTDKTGEPIDILSSDEDGSAAPKLPKINDQITITPHIPSSNRNMNNTSMDSTAKSRQNQNNVEKKRKPDLNKSITASKKKFEIGASKNVKVSFEDIGGISEIITQICDLVLHMKHPEVYNQLGIKSPRGALLHGPPGTGKTLLANAIAGKLKLPLVAVTGTELVGGMSGESEERIRELFEKAVSVAPCVLFIDEIDAVCGNRINAQKDMEKRMVAQLLASLDSLSDSSVSVLVLAATNNPDALDPALRRAGRLEQEITLGIPTLKARKEILDILCKNMALDDDVDIAAIAQITPGFVGADLQALVNKASTHAVKRVFAEIREKQQQQLLQKKTEEKIEKPSISSEEVAEIPNGEKEGEEPQVNETGDAPSTAEVPPSETEPTEPPKEINNEEETVSQPPPPEIKIIDPTEEVLNLLGEAIPYTSQELSGLSIKQEDFLKAIKTTKPCAVREGIVTVPDVTWDDVGSLSQVRKDLQLAVLAPVKYPEQLKKLGLSAPSGVLLCGPPGCGKTLLAKAVANEAGVNFISVKGPELLNMYVGESERAVRTCFRRARNSAPCVIFFDEFDALCPRRTSQDHNGAARVVNQLLTEMDGIESREGVFVLAASNRPDIIDPAVLRPGRLDRVMYVGMPQREDRFDILQKLTKNGARPQLGADVDLQVVAELTESYTGADLAGLVRAAATNALTNHISNGTLEGEIFVTFEDFRAALAKCKPSVSTKEQLHYEKLRLKYASGADDKDMEMETEPTNEESMDTV